MVKVPNIKLFVVVAVKASPNRIHPWFAGELFPLGLFLLRPLVVMSSPWFAGFEIQVVAYEGQPVFAGDHFECVSLQSFCSNANLPSALAFTDVDFDEGTRGWFGDDLEPGTTDLFQIGLQFLSPELGGSSRFCRKYDLSLRLTALNEVGFGRFRLPKGKRC